VGFSPRVALRNFGLLHAFLSDQASPGALKVKVKVDVQSGDDGCTSGVVARVGIFDSIAASSATRLDLVDLP